MNYISPTFVLGINFLREFASDKTTSILGSTSVVFALTSVIFRMVHFWNSFLGNTIYEEEDCFKWTYCKDCGIYRWVRVCTGLYTFVHFFESTNQIQIFSTNVSIKEHKELLCPKRIQSCIYKSTGCPFKGPADTMMSHQASCQYRPGYNIIKCEICGDPIHLPKFSKTKFENQKRCFNCRLVYFEGLCPIWAV